MVRKARTRAARRRSPSPEVSDPPAVDNSGGSGGNLADQVKKSLDLISALTDQVADLSAKLAGNRSGGGSSGSSASRAGRPGSSRSNASTIPSDEEEEQIRALPERWREVLKFC